ncbi:MAG TPA: tRNA (pseudouridine(54)-N(1))-methyltransferase TrmY [Rhodanobacteraceae bacterium]|nr:tRNA (pseudouridine(54)-N(1))-methyltransferase TrmY [Rhodanobacteraceae bacterium]
MRVFVLRARAAPTDSALLLQGVGTTSHTEILAHVLMNAIFVAQSHRPDVIVHLVLESTRDYSRTIRFESNAVTGFSGFHEAAWLGKIATALDHSRGMEKDTSRDVEPGITVSTVSFERLVQELAQNHPLFVLDKKGQPLRDVALPAKPCFLLTDHIPMPKKAFNGLKRLGTQKLSLGPTMLFASQCITLIHNELDLRSD